MRQLTFIVSTGRAGSTALSRLLHQHPDVLSLREFYSSLGSPAAAFPGGKPTAEDFWRLLAEPHDLRDRLIRSGLSFSEMLYPRQPGRFDSHRGGIPAICLITLAALAPPGDALFDELETEIRAWPPRPVAEHYLALFEWLSVRMGRRVVVERSGYSLHFVPALRRAFPHARFVHLHRDGPDCALSMSGHSGFRLGALAQEISERAGVPPQDWLTVSSDDPRIPDDLRPLLRRHFSRELIMDRSIPLSRFGSFWSRTIEQGLADLAAVPAGRRITIRYENLVEHPDAELTRLAEMVGVDPLPQWLRQGREMLDPGRRGKASLLDAADHESLVHSCSPGMRALGLG